MTLNFQAYKVTFDSNVTAVRDTDSHYRVTSRVNENPKLKYFISDWNICTMEGGKKSQVDYMIEFECFNMLFDRASKMIIDKIAGNSIEVFAKRAKENYSKQKKLDQEAAASEEIN